MKLTNENNGFFALYSDSKYEKPSVTVDAVIFRLINKENNNYRKLPEKKLQVFLTKRDYPPFKNYFAAVGTFIDLNNELSESMKLCVKNKVNLDNFYHEQLFTFGDKSRDPRTRVISVSYLLLTNENSVLTNGEWFDIDLKQTSCERKQKENGYLQKQTINLTLKNENLTLENQLLIELEKTSLEEKKQIQIKNSTLAFDHIKIIFYALERLKNKLEYTDIIFNLLPEKFTLTELKQCYEVILNEKLLDANFRRKTSKMVQATNEFVRGKGHRSSQLFKHNPNWTILNLD